MSATFGKPSDTPEREDESLFISVATTADGRVESVQVSELEPYADDTLYRSGRTTVWTVEYPEYSDTDTFDADKTLDLAHTFRYRHQDADGWVKGERIAADFYASNSPERATLRAIEAHLIQAGYLDAYTGMVMCQGYGLTLIQGGEEFYVFRMSDGWHRAMRDHTSCDGWYEFPGVFAPADASPRRVANEIIDELACIDLDLYERLPLRHRARVYVRTFGWRARLHRITYRLTRFSRTVRARIAR
ncbi:hypothetical protein [Streptomyces coeruleorubidus]|uniref:hypothetical protein n=1 Tax=Streptomyces coeruleorubidus TaxID=116188 RepID=UPI0033BA9849